MYYYLIHCKNTVSFSITSFWLLLPRRCPKQSRHPERWWWCTPVCMSRWGQRARSWHFLRVHAGWKGTIISVYKVKNMHYASCRESFCGSLPSVRWWRIADRLHKLSVSLLAYRGQTPQWRNSTETQNGIVNKYAFVVYSHRNSQISRPVITYCGEFLYRVIQRSQWRETDLLTELSKAGLGQKRDVSKQLVTCVSKTERWVHMITCLEQRFLYQYRSLII